MGRDSGALNRPLGKLHPHQLHFTSRGVRYLCGIGILFRGVLGGNKVKR